MRWSRCASTRFWTGYIRLFVSAVAVCFGIMLISSNAPATVSELSRRVSCLRLFDISRARRFWESPSEVPPTTCLGSGLLPEHATACLTRRRQQRGRPAFVMFIGDSRARIIFMKVRETLKLLWRRHILHDVYQTQENATLLEHGQRVRCPHSTPMFHKTKFLKHVCFLEVVSNLVRATYYWTPYIEVGYLDRLKAVEEDCRLGRDCPDLVVMTLGMWYAKTEMRDRGMTLKKLDRTLHFAHELQKLVPVLRNMSTHSQLLYRVDESEFLEGQGNKSVNNGALLTISAAAVETFRQQVPGLKVWSSSLAETVRFQHTMCLRLAAIHTPILGIHQHECMDENHVAETVRRSAAAAIVRYLCRDTEQHPPGHCCDTVV